jgi:Domain of unknown function (DUF4340)
MQRRTFNMLLGGAAVSAMAAGLALAIGDRTASPPQGGGRALPGLAERLGELARIRLTRGALTINFLMSGGRWTVVEKGNYPAAEDRVRKLLVALAELELVDPKTDRTDLLARLDLDDPANGKSTLVAVQDRNGAQVAALVIGRRRPSSVGGEAGVYVRKPDTDQAWLARGSFDVSGDELAWLDRRILDLPAARIASIVLTAPDGNFIVVDRAAAGDLAVEGSPDPPDPGTAAALAGTLAELDLDDVKPALEQPIPADGSATAAFTTSDGLIVGARLGPPDTGGDWVAFTATGSGKAADAAKTLAADLAPWSYRISAERAKLLRMTLAELHQPRGS